MTNSKIVPVEPTEEMIDVMYSILTGTDEGCPAWVKDDYVNAYKSMLAVATPESTAAKPLPATMLCEKHGGYGFVSDCVECKQAKPNYQISEIEHEVLRRAFLNSRSAVLSPLVKNLSERLRLAMNFIEEWANWWAYGLKKPNDAEPSADDEAKAASFGQRAAQMVIDNRRALGEASPSSPASAADKRDETIRLLTEKLNHAVTELTRAALSEDFDSDDCMRCVERIQSELVSMGKTSDWHQLAHWYDRFCAALGVSNEDEIDIYPMVETRLLELKNAVAAVSAPLSSVSAPAEIVNKRLQELIDWIIREHPDNHLDAIHAVRDAKALIEQMFAARRSAIEECAMLCKEQQLKWLDSTEDHSGHWADAAADLEQFIRALLVVNADLPAISPPIRNHLVADCLQAALEQVIGRYADGHELARGRSLNPTLVALDDACKAAIQALNMVSRSPVFEIIGHLWIMNNGVHHVMWAPISEDDAMYSAPIKNYREDHVLYVKRKPA